jgi:hypothetical protein
MKKHFILPGLLFFHVFALAQHDFLAYSVKGRVSYTLNGPEHMLKIGKVVKGQAVIKLSKESMVTFICEGRHRLTFEREGIYALNHYQDSCIEEKENMLSNYFKYIWDQLYVHSSDKSRMWNRGRPARGSGTSKPERIYENDPALDTVRYASGNFPLHWHANYNGPFLFRLFSAVDDRQLISKKIHGYSIPMEKISGQMKPGNYYYWTANPDTDEASSQVIQYITHEQLRNYIDSIGIVNGLVENPAERYFRIAFFLETDRYFSHAYEYYRKAAAANSGNSLYKEVVKHFEKEYGIKD